MKKIVGTIAAIALAASSAFAGVNVGMGFNPALFSVGAENGNVKMSLDSPFGSSPRVGASFSASNDVCGVVAALKFDGEDIGINDELYVWVKPVSWLKVQLGSSFDDTLRGSFGFGSNDWLRPANILNDDITFARLSRVDALYTSVTGAIVSLDPIEGLHIAASLQPGYGAPVAAETVFQNAQVQAGYTIADVMQIKAQWIGWAKTVNAAVALKAVENMTLEAGVYIPTASAERADDKLGHKTKIGAFWGMPVGPVALKVNAEVALAANDTETTDVKAGAGIDFDCGNGLGIGADVVYGQKFKKDDDLKAGIAISAWVSKSIPNGMFGVAFQCAMNDKLNTYDASDFTFAVPFKVNVGF